MFLAKISQALHEADEEEEEAQIGQIQAAEAETDVAMAPAADIPILAAPAAPATSSQTPARPQGQGSLSAGGMLIEQPPDEGRGTPPGLPPPLAAPNLPPPSHGRHHTPATASASMRVLRRRSSAGAGLDSSATRRVTPDGLVFRRCAHTPPRLFLPFHSRAHLAPSHFAPSAACSLRKTRTSAAAAASSSRLAALPRSMMSDDASGVTVAQLELRALPVLDQPGPEQAATGAATSALASSSALLNGGGNAGSSTAASPQPPLPTKPLSQLPSAEANSE
jgi:hypothetical protein